MSVIKCILSIYAIISDYDQFILRNALSQWLEPLICYSLDGVETLENFGYTNDSPFLLLCTNYP